MRLADIRDDGIYTVTWRDGRTATTIITNEKFEILTDLAVEAYCDRYFREAVLTCASALDAYLDFHVEVVLRTQGHPREIIAALLKSTAKQAERRLGAFLAIEAASGQQPDYIKASMVELRNSIVHKGYLASEDEAFG